MKIPWLCSFAVLCASTAFGRTSASWSTPPSPSDTPRTLALTGCVAGGSTSEPVTLTQAMVLPFGSAAGAAEPAAAPDPSASALPEPSRVSAGATQPQTATQPETTTPTATSAAAGAAGTIGTGSTVAVGTSGAAGASSAAASTLGAIGTSGSIIGTAPTGSSASSVGGYRLSGVDMTSWIGRRVQIIGTVVPATPIGQAVAVDSSERVALAAMPEFRVLSVQPVTGSCPK